MSNVYYVKRNVKCFLIIVDNAIFLIYNTNVLNKYIWTISVRLCDSLRKVAGGKFLD